MRSTTKARHHRRRCRVHAKHLLRITSVRNRFEGIQRLRVALPLASEQAIPGLLVDPNASILMSYGALSQQVLSVFHLRSLFAIVLYSSCLGIGRADLRPLDELQLYLAVCVD